MILKRIFAAALGAVALCGLSPGAQATEFLRLYASTPGGVDFVIGTSIANIVNQNVDDVEVQVTVNKPATRAVVDAAMGNADLVVTASSIIQWMIDGERMYKDLPDHAALAGRLRGIFAFSVGAYQWVARADSGIESLADLRGRKVFAGPRNSAAASVVIDTIRAETGMEPDVDYELVALDWNAGAPAFQDRQVDVYVRPTELPSGGIQQFALAGDIRLLPIRPETLASEALRPVVETPGRVIVDVAPDIYGDRQANRETIKAIGSIAGYGSHVGVDAEVIYKVTKAFWENIDELHNAAVWAKSINRDTVFDEMRIPLHAGAWRYYLEAGFNPPEALKPPEADQ